MRLIKGQAVCIICNVSYKGTTLYEESKNEVGHMAPVSLYCYRCGDFLHHSPFSLQQIVAMKKNIRKGPQLQLNMDESAEIAAAKKKDEDFETSFPTSNV